MISHRDFSSGVTEHENWLANDSPNQLYENAILEPGTSRRNDELSLTPLISSVVAFIARQKLSVLRRTQSIFDLHLTVNTMLRSSTLRACNSASSALSSTFVHRASRIARIARPTACLFQQSSRQAHAISNPTLANIEKRWEEMPPQEQADLWMQLRDRMKVDWHEMTLQEKKAGMLEFTLRKVMDSSVATGG